ncbi:MAG: HEAT repeat domain-containing protein, partial [Planctomycetaceae bacterium]
MNDLRILDRRNTPRSIVLIATASAFGCALSAFASGDEPASAVASVMKLLKSGRVPQSRLGPVIEQVARRGNAHDLAYLYEQADRSGDYDAALRLQVYQLLVEAAETRRAIPAGDLTRITDVVATADSDWPELRLAAIRLAGLWRVPSSVPPLQTIVADNSSSARVRQAALTALTAIGGSAARDTLAELTGESQTMAARLQAVAALVVLDVDFAAVRAGQLLQEMQQRDDPSVIIGAFLDRDGGSRKLAAAVAATPPSPDVALRALRHMYSVGRSDEELADALGRIAGIDANPQPLNIEQVARMVARVAVEGDAVRGETVFRRNDLACLKCHAVSKGGGQIGPDLSPLGASSPVDYIVNSIANPDQQIKEAFTTRVVITTEGLVHQGIVIDRNEQRLVLKDAKGEQVVIPVSEIDEEAEGKSLMPKGLMKFMTDSEFIDLVQFLSMLGRPGTEYAIRQTPRMQRWRVFADAPESLRIGTADEAAQEDYLSSPAQQVPAYSRVNGDLPLDDLAAQYGPVLFLAGEVDVTRDGDVGVRIDSADGVSLSIGSFTSAAPEFTLRLPRGRHTMLLRVYTRERHSATLRLELFHVSGSPS